MLAECLLVFIVFLCGFVVTGVVGFGGNVLVLPILSLFGLPVHKIVLMMALISFVNAFFRVMEYHRAIIWRKLFSVWSVTIPGSFLGIWLLHTLPEQFLKTLLGVFIVSLAFYNLFKRQGFTNLTMLQKEAFSVKIIYHILLFFGGVLQGAFVCGGPLYVIYCSHYFGHNTHCYRAMQFGVMFFNSLIVFVTYFLQGDYRGEIVWYCAPALIGLGIAVWLSEYMLHFINDKKLYLLIQWVLVFSGMSLLLQIILAA